MAKGEAHEEGRAMETNGSIIDTSDSCTYAQREGTAYLLKRVGTGYENRLSVRGFDGKA